MRLPSGGRAHSKRASWRHVVRQSLAVAFNLWLVIGLSLTSRAGDILRGGMTSRVGTGGAPAPVTARPLPTGAQPNDSLARTTQALQAVQAMQSAARNLARSGPPNLGRDPNHPGLQLPNVPNGLTPGGLQVAPGVPANLAHPTSGEDPSLWTGATLPSQTTANGQTDVTIKQTAQQALLNWQTFNVGKETSVTFDQTAGGSNASQWIAFNTINDPSGIPSQILGSIDALGQIYLINQNGIIFGGSSQINLHSLVASSLPLNSNLVQRGLLNNPDDQFLFSSLEIPILPNGGTMPAFNPPPPPNTPDGRIGDVTVQAGAQLTSPTSEDHVGGRIALVGPNVTNDGTISTPDGQTILAAGQQVAFAAHTTTDPSLRGLDVYVGAVDDSSGTASNSGLIEAPRADVTMVGRNVNQLGFIDSSTSVTLNGRIDLLAAYNTVVPLVLGLPHFNPSASGTVTFGQDSVTQVLPELTSTETIVGTQLALGSQVNVQAEAIHLGIDALLVAPSAQVTMSAGTWIQSSDGFAFVASEGQIYLDSGSLIDVSGSRDVSASVTENIIPVQLLGPELANSPLQRNGPLRGQTINIDIREHGPYDPSLNDGQGGYTWVGTPLADTSGYVSLVKRSVGELTIAGGSVNLTAGESVIMQPESEVNVSGGWIDYQGGIVSTTQVISDGHILDISQATPDRIYSGIFGQSTVVHPKWGISETMANPLSNMGHFEASYVQGGNGGSISLSAPAVALDGNLVGGTVLGPRQQASVPLSSALSLTFQAQQPVSPLFLEFSPTPPDITFSPNSTLTPAEPFALDSDGKPLPLRADRLANVVLSPELLSTDGFGTLNIDDSDGKIVVPVGVSLTASANGSVTLQGANVDVEGAITAPGGQITLAAYDFSPFELAELRITPGAQTPPADPTRGALTLGSAAILSTTGLIIDERQVAPSTDVTPLATNGGVIDLKGYSTLLRPGSTIDVSGGVVVNTKAIETFGNAGSISITGGQDPNLPSILGGRLVLGATLTGYSGTQTGGALAIQAPLIRIGGNTATDGTLLLQPSFFDQGGFSSYTLTGLGEASSEAGQYIPGVLISPNLTIAPAVQSWVGNLDSGPIQLAPTLLPESLRAPATLSFAAPGVRDEFTGDLISRGDVILSAGSSLLPGPKGSVSLTGDTVTVLGSIGAAGGTISINGATNSTLLFPDPTSALPTVDLGPNSSLSVAGTTVLTPNPFGFRTGSVLPGGAITVSGNVVAESGALLDVSGASDVLDFPPELSGVSMGGEPQITQVLPARVESNAGSITFSGGQELFVDATLLGAAGGPSALGGNLTISSGRFYPPDSTNPSTPLDVTLRVSQTGPTIPTNFYPSDGTAIGHPVPGSDGSAAEGLGYFAADSLDSHTFDIVTLKGTVEFSGPVSVAANRKLLVGTSGVIFGDDAINLDAPYVAIGSGFQPPVSPLIVVPPFTVAGQPFNFSPTIGPGSLNISASLIDIGNLSLQNISAANFQAPHGDIRGDGTFELAGNIAMTAGQVYAPTEVTFTIAAFDYSIGGITYPGSITINPGDARPLPYSAGSHLNLYASIINQNGVLRAPVGTINLGSGVLTTPPIDPISNQPFPATQQLTLGSGSIASVSAIDPLTGNGLVIPYGSNLNGTSWIDPAAVDITGGGLPGKTINVSGVQIDDQANSSIDIRGGGDLYAYRFVSGVGGTNDILDSDSSFAVIPGYGFDYAPIDPVYSNGTLSVGDQIYLNSGSGLAAGTYTLLPARYALLPGGFLITPKTGTPPTSVLQPDGASVVSGYRFNDLNPARSGQPLNSLFEIAPQSVVQSRATYDNFSANSFLLQSATARDIPIPRLPIDSGELVLAAANSLDIHGSVTSVAPVGGAGGRVDISSPASILISPSGGDPGVLQLDPRELSAFGADSLLIGGFRQAGLETSVVTVTTPNITVDNVGSPLTGPDLILVATNSLTLDPGATIEQRGTPASAIETLMLGSDDTPGSGNGVLLRVTSDPMAGIIRDGVDSSSLPSLVVDAGAQVSGQSVTLDSTNATSVDPTASVLGNSVALNSGQISLVLSNPGEINPTTGLILSGEALQNLEASTQALSLLSYSSFDIYGIGQVGALDAAGDPAAASFALHAAEIRGFNNEGGIVSFVAKDLFLDNSPEGTVPGSSSSPLGSLQFVANTIHLGENQLAIDQFAKVTLAASNSILLEESGGLSAQGSIALLTPLVTGSVGASQTINAAGDLTVSNPARTAATLVSSGLGVSLTLQGASVTLGSDLLFPSGSVTLHATNGDVLVTGAIDVSGTAQNFFDLTEFTNGGQVNLTSDTGYVLLPPGSLVDVSAGAGGGDAGAVSISAPERSFFPGGTLLGQPGANGLGGTFSLDTGVLASLALLDNYLDSGSFSQARSIRVRTGDVVLDGHATTNSFNLSTDLGSITVTGIVDASGTVGGTISLESYGDLVLSGGSLLNVAGQQLNAAGAAGAISLETTHGSITIDAGSTIDLFAGNGSGGTLHLRAPQTGDATDLAINPIVGGILSPGSVIAEGFFVQDANTSGVAFIDDFESTALANANLFASYASAIQTRLLSSNSSLATVFHVRPGEEIDNSQGDLTLNQDWDFSTWRFGERKPVVDNAGNFLYDLFGNQIFAGIEPGVLTLRASGSITLNGSLNDGFGDSGGQIDIPIDDFGNPAPWKEGLLPRFADGTTQQSWSYRITAGADFTAADFRRVQPLTSLSSDSGSLSLGVSGGYIAIPPGDDASSDSALEGHYQVIRTGTGDIEINVGRDLNLLNQFATIYTGGAQVSDPTLGGTFDTPRLFSDPDGFFPVYPAQYSSNGGNVTIFAQNDIAHLTKDVSGDLIPDSERQLPTNWLDRRGYVDPTTSEFGVALFGDVASTSWWIDFSNFFEGVGALGGGNVTLKAGHDISNVDAVVPTNARAPIGKPDASAFVELGGGNLFVQAGHDIDGGAYYVERGTGSLSAGNSIHTNSTRSPSLTLITHEDPFPLETWLPTTLFLGKGTFDIQAREDVLLGPTVNPFLLPPGLRNTYWYKTYFSTYSLDSAVNVTSLAGAVSLRDATTLPTSGIGATTSILLAWIQDQFILTGGDSSSYYQPWLRSAETDATPFLTETELMPPTLRAVAFSGDINLNVRLSLSPSPTGTLDLAAAGAINGLQVNGETTILDEATNGWAASTINLSDANPAAIPGAMSPFAYQLIVGTNTALASVTGTDFLNGIDTMFNESGSTQGTFGVLQTKQALHAPGPLHLNDPNPVHVYATDGDISGLTLFSAKSARIVAGDDVTDIAFYLQNNQAGDLSVVAAGRDLIAYDPNSTLRSAAQAPGNTLDIDENPLAGDIQINGPGTLEVLAGRNLDLGVGNNNLDGTGLGITSIGNGRNPNLPFVGADIIAGAGIGLAAGDLQNSSLNFDSFVSQFLNPDSAPAESSRYLPEVAALLNLNASSDAETWAAFNQLTPEKQDQTALQVFYFVLRDAGRDHNDPDSPGFNNFDAANAAIAALFPGDQWLGDISLTSREIKTKNGGNISLFAPGGAITVGFDVGENQAVDQGILTEHGGNISMYSQNSVTLGTSRIFTLRGGNEIIYSALGDIAAGVSSKTVQAAPPTRVLIDPQSADVQTDLAGLATGGGIGVLESVAGVPPGDVDLIAPSGTVDAGDAGIRVSGNLNISAVLVLNATNIQVGGTSAGTQVVAAPNLASLTAASNTTGATANAAAEATQEAHPDASQSDLPSIVTVEVLGYGGGDDEDLDQQSRSPRKKS